jgi:arylsulfatase A-like enzyme
MTDMVLRWLDAAPGKPFLAVAWTQGTHHPYDLPPGREPTDFFRGEEPVDAWDLGKYLNALREADAQIGRLLDGLRARGLADDTLVVVTGDHGEAFGWPHPNYGHSYKLYEEDVHVPFVLWNPRLFSVPRRSALVGAHVDLGPTILDVLGLPAPADWIGRSLLGTAHPGRAYFYGARDPYTLGVREGRHKYILDVTNGREELYDVVADRDEQENLHAMLPEVSARLRARVTAWFRAASR